MAEEVKGRMVTVEKKMEMQAKNIALIINSDKPEDQKAYLLIAQMSYLNSIVGSYLKPMLENNPGSPIIQMVKSTYETLWEDE